MAEFPVSQSIAELREKYRRKKERDVSKAEWKSVPYAVAEFIMGGEPGSPEQIAGATGISNPIAYASTAQFADAVADMIVQGRKKGVDENILQGLAGLNRALQEGRITEKTAHSVKKISYSPHMAGASTIGDSGPIRYTAKGGARHSLSLSDQQRWMQARNEYANKFKLPPAGYAEGIDQYININPRPDLSSQFTPRIDVPHIARVTPLHETMHVYYGGDPSSAVDPVYLAAKDILEPNPHAELNPFFGLVGDIPERNLDAVFGLRTMSDARHWTDLYQSNYITNPSEFIADVAGNRHLFQMYGTGDLRPLSNVGAQGMLFPSASTSIPLVRAFDEALAYEIGKLRLHPGTSAKMNELLLSDWLLGRGK